MARRRPFHVFVFFVGFDKKKWKGRRTMVIDNCWENGPLVLLMAYIFSILAAAKVGNKHPCRDMGQGGGGRRGRGRRWGSSADVKAN